MITVGEPMADTTEYTTEFTAEIMLAGEKVRLSGLAAGLHGVAETRSFSASTGAEVLEWLENGDTACRLVVIDERLDDMTGLDLARKIAISHPFVNSGLVSSLNHDQFHACTEGLGLLMQLNSPPVAAEGTALIDHFKNINSL